MFVAFQLALFAPQVLSQIIPRKGYLRNYVVELSKITWEKWSDHQKEIILPEFLGILTTHHSMDRAMIDIFI